MENNDDVDDGECTPENVRVAIFSSCEYLEIHNIGEKLYILYGRIFVNILYRLRYYLHCNINNQYDLLQIEQEMAKILLHYTCCLIVLTICVGKYLY